MTNTNLLTKIQEDAIVEAIVESMRISLSRSNLAFDPNFEKGCTAVAESVIAKTKKILSIKKVETKDTPKDTFKVRLLKNEPLRDVKKSDLERITRSDKEFKKYIKNNPVKNARK